MTQLCEAEIAVLHDEATRATALLDEALAAFDSMGMAWHFDAAARLRSLLSSRAE